MDCSPPGSSVRGNSPSKKIGMGCHALLQGIFPTQSLYLGLLHCRRILYHLSHQKSPNTRNGFSTHLTKLLLPLFPQWGNWGSQSVTGPGSQHNPSRVSRCETSLVGWGTLELLVLVIFLQSLKILNAIMGTSEKCVGGRWQTRFENIWKVDILDLIDGGPFRLSVSTWVLGSCLLRNLSFFVYVINIVEIGFILIIYIFMPVGSVVMYPLSFLILEIYLFVSYIHSVMV